MRRAELEHVIRASAAITGDKSFVVVGSQAVLLPYPDAPAELLLSNEVDLYPAMHPELSDLIDGAIGQLSAGLNSSEHQIEHLQAWARLRHAEATR